MEARGGEVGWAVGWGFHVTSFSFDKIKDIKGVLLVCRDILHFKVKDEKGVLCVYHQSVFFI